MKKIHVCSVLMVFVFSACRKEKPIVFYNGDLEITSGFVCGWCSGADSITFINHDFEYQSFNPCTQEPKEAKKTGTVSEEQWSELAQLLDFDDFSAIDLNTCHVCADGCDNWVRIRQENEEHMIRYGNNHSDSLKIRPVLPFLEKLDSLKNVLINQ